MSEEGHASRVESDVQLLSAIDDVLLFVDAILPTQFVIEQDTLGDVFGCAAVRRLADLVRAERILATSGEIATSRVIGRSAIEAWLWAVYLFLDPEHALDRLVAESEGHQRRRLIGMNRLWERIEDLKSSNLDTPAPVPPSAGTANPDIKALAEATADVMRAHGYKGDRADGKYHNDYRWDSMFDVHPSFELLMRYFDIDEESRTATIEPTARAEEADDLRGVGGTFDSALLLLEALGIYAQTRGITVRPDVHARLSEIAGMKGR